MKVKTPAMKIDLRIDSLEVRGAELVLGGVAGARGCAARSRRGCCGGC
jgi:hypothetical protein